MAATAVQHLTEAEGDATPVLFFFFRHIIHANRHPKCLVRDWFAQLLPHGLVVLQRLLQPMKETRIDSVPDEALWESLLAGLEHVPKAFCVADAQDEMDTKDSAVFTRLNQLATFRPPQSSCS